MSLIIGQQALLRVLIAPSFRSHRWVAVQASYTAGNIFQSHKRLENTINFVMPAEISVIPQSSLPTFQETPARIAVRSASYDSLDSIETFSPRATKRHQPMAIDMLYDTGAWMLDLPSLPPVKNTLIDCFPSPRPPIANSSTSIFVSYLELDEGVGSSLIKDDDMDVFDPDLELIDCFGLPLIEDDHMVIIQLPIEELARAPPGVTDSATDGSSVSKSGEESKKSSAAKQENDNSESGSSKSEFEEPSGDQEQDYSDEVNGYWANLWKESTDVTNFGADLSSVPGVFEGAGYAQSSATDEKPHATVELSAYETSSTESGSDTSSNRDIEGGSSGDEADDEGDSEPDLSEEDSDAEQEFGKENHSVRSALTDHVVEDALLEIKDLRDETSGSARANENGGAQLNNGAGSSPESSGRLSRRRKFGDTFSSAGAESGSSISSTPRARDLDGERSVTGSDEVITGGTVRDAARRLEYRKRAKISGKVSGSTDVPATGWTATDNGESAEVQRGRILQSGGKWRGLRH